MKKSKLSKSTRQGGLLGRLIRTLAVRKTECSSSRLIVPERMDMKPITVTVDRTEGLSLRPVTVKVEGLGTVKVPSAFRRALFGPKSAENLEVRCITKQEARKLRREGHRVHILRPVDPPSIVEVIGAYATRGRGEGRGGFPMSCRAACVSGSILAYAPGADFSVGGGRTGAGIPAGGGGWGADIPASGGGSGAGGWRDERRFLAFVLTKIGEQRKILDEQEAKVRKRLLLLPPDDEDEQGGQEAGKKAWNDVLFAKRIDEGRMVQTFREVYAHYRSKELFDKDFKPVDLIAYLFVMVVCYGYGRDDLRTTGQHPFFRFFTEKVAPDLKGVRGVTRKSMGNRLRGPMKNLLPKSTHWTKLSVDERVEYEISKKKYDEIWQFFHDTEYGTLLKKNFVKR